MDISLVIFSDDVSRKINCRLTLSLAFIMINLRRPCNRISWYTQIETVLGTNCGAASTAPQQINSTFFYRPFRRGALCASECCQARTAAAVTKLARAGSGLRVAAPSALPREATTQSLIRPRFASRRAHGLGFLARRRRGRGRAGAKDEACP